MPAPPAGHTRRGSLGSLLLGLRQEGGRGGLRQQGNRPLLQLHEPQFVRHLPGFYPLFVDLMHCDSKELRQILRDIFSARLDFNEIAMMGLGGIDGPLDTFRKIGSPDEKREAERLIAVWNRIVTDGRAADERRDAYGSRRRRRAKIDRCGRCVRPRPVRRAG